MQKFTDFGLKWGTGVKDWTSCPKYSRRQKKICEGVVTQKGNIVQFCTVGRKAPCNKEAPYPDRIIK